MNAAAVHVVGSPATIVRMAQAIYLSHQSGLNARWDADQLTDLMGTMLPKCRAEFSLDWNLLDNDSRYVYCDMAQAALEALYER